MREAEGRKTRQKLLQDPKLAQIDDVLHDLDFDGLKAVTVLVFARRRQLQRLADYEAMAINGFEVGEQVAWKWLENGKEFIGEVVGMTERSLVVTTSAGSSPYTVSARFCYYPDKIYRHAKEAYRKVNERP